MNGTAATHSTVTVYGAYGHTGRFVVAELAARGYRPVLAGRDAARLAASTEATGHEARPAPVDDPAALDRALAATAAVINCAGPFAATTGPVIEAALRAGIPYLDVAAELEANLDTFAHYADRARREKAIVVPAMAFFGGLGDLLVTTAMGDWTHADEAHIAYGLSYWHPTAGTRLSGAVSRERRGAHRLRYSGGAWQRRTDAPPTAEWLFPAPMGPRQVVTEFTMADVVTVTDHLPISDVHTHMALDAARDIASSATPAPTATDELGRSDQTFLVDVIVRADGVERRAVASGRDIYAVTAPLVVEALDRVLTGRIRTTGVASAGRIFDAPDFLTALAPHIELTTDA
ncbi:trans-acting enoyl reductase family protein [Streptomyces sp. WAC06614]|uniref:saccharopine dehydrogenase family protein n=1 Tax=Streptomyces sp. WAC06614 TaxID=2487416 RepID=UPI0021AF114B|nr:saccharopine dehydrogenase NADP-binding domain-containing protein [Streptomyces sp. WAC06614]